MPGAPGFAAAPATGGSGLPRAPGCSRPGAHLRPGRSSAVQCFDSDLSNVRPRQCSATGALDPSRRPRGRQRGFGPRRRPSETRAQDGPNTCRAQHLPWPPVMLGKKNPRGRLPGPDVGPGRATRPRADAPPPAHAPRPATTRAALPQRSPSRRGAAHHRSAAGAPTPIMLSQSPLRSPKEIEWPGRSC